jgi:hypothetical protein
VSSVDLVRHVLAWGIAVPVIYFGVQVSAAPFYPGYSFFSRDASSLGSNASAAPWIFNFGTLVLGLVLLTLAGAFLCVLPRARIGRGLASLMALALASAGMGSVNAFLHPLPDPRHTDGWLAALGGGVVLLPGLTALVLWRLGRRRLAIGIIIAFLALIPLMTGLVQRAFMQAGIGLDGYQSFLNNYHGLIQRLGAVVIFVPVAVVTHVIRSGR